MKNNLLYLCFFLFLSFATQAQSSVVTTKDTSLIMQMIYYDDLLENIGSKGEILPNKGGEKYTFNHHFPTFIYPWDGERKANPILIFPNDSIELEKSKEGYITCTFPQDSLRNVHANFDRQYGSEIQVSGYSIQNMSKSEHLVVIHDIKLKMNRLLSTIFTYPPSVDSSLLRSTVQEVKSIALSSVLMPFVSGSTDWRKFPQWYVDSVKLFKEEIFGADTLIKGAEYRRALFYYNQFLCRDSLNGSKDFYVQFNSAMLNFKGEHRDFLMAYLLNKYKVENLPDFYDYVGVFYAICQNETFLKYVKDKIDDTNFTFPEFMLTQKLIHENGQTTTWKDLLAQNKGKLIYLDFYASWCPPCIFLTPYVKEHAKALKDKPIVFISISSDKSMKVWKKALAKYKLSGDGIQAYWLGNKTKFQNFLYTRRENEKISFAIPRYMIFDHKGNFITSNALQPHFKTSRKQIEIFLKDVPTE